MKLDPMQINSSLLAKPVALNPPPRGMDMKKIEETARDFEAMFVSEMMKPIFESVKVDETFGGGKGEEIFRGFMREEYAKTMTQVQSIGIAEQVKEELIAMQSKAERASMAQNMQGQPQVITASKGQETE